MTWRHKEEWTRRGTDCLVVVSRHEEAVSEYDRDRGPHRWCVYAYVYPKHPLFERIATRTIFDSALDGLPLHAGCSYNRWHESDGAVTSKQIGADYSHLYDEHFTHMRTKEQAVTVFGDADALFDALHVEATIEPEAAVAR